MKITAHVMILALSAFVACEAAAQRADDPSARGTGSGGGAPEFHLLPPPVQEQLNLTSVQQRQLATLESQIRARLADILSPEQLRLLEQTRPPRPGEGPRGVGMGRPGERPDRAERPGGMRPGGPPARLIEVLDADGDHTIDAEELANAGAALKKLDQNKDGKLAPEEYRGPFPEGPGRRSGPSRSSRERSQRPQRPAFED